ncbi:hypothetical protein ACRAWF_40480 [Streptomyces sp. L7]
MSSLLGAADRAHGLGSGHPAYQQIIAVFAPSPSRRRSLRARNVREGAAWTWISCQLPSINHQGPHQTGNA